MMVYADEVTEIPIHVHNGFLIKHIIDDPEVKDGLILIGTFIQHAFSGPSTPGHETASGSDEEDNLLDPPIRMSDRKHSIPQTVLTSGVSTATPQRIFKRHEKAAIRFGYRFNDQTADERSGWVDWRRTEKHRTRDLGECYRHTFQIKAPLELDVIFNAFPFKVVGASLLIEMSTYTTPDSRTRLRPNLLLHTKEKRVMCGIQKAYKKSSTISQYSSTSMFAPSQNKEFFLQAKEKVDRSYVYDFASPFPNITYYYDTNKEYCPKYSVTFLLVEDGMKKFVEIVFPMLLIAAMNHLNVLNAVCTHDNWCPAGVDEKDKVDAVAYLNNSATLALAVVVFLPTMFGRARFHEIFNANNLYVTTIFVGLALSAIPYSLVANVWPARVGAWIFWGSFLFPVINGFRFVFFVRSQRQALRPEFFMDDAVNRNHAPDAKVHRFKPKGDRDVLGEFIPIKDLVELSELRLAQMEYRVEEPPKAKFKIVEYDNEPELVRLQHSMS